MRNPTVFRAIFSGYIIHIFGKPQTLQWDPEIEMHQLRDCPELWGTRMTATKKPLTWQAGSPAALARTIEEHFVERLTEWTPAVSSGASLPRQQPKNVIIMPLKREA